MRKSLLLLLFMLLSFGSVHPQTDSLSAGPQQVHYDHTEGLQPVGFSKEKITALKNQKAFSYVDKSQEVSWWTRFKRWVSLKYEQLLHWLFGDYKANSFLLFIFKLLPYLLLAILLGLIVWLFIRLNPGGSILEEPAQAKVYASKEEELIQSREIQKLIEEAVKNGQFRLAVRYHYLQNLQQLDQLNFISYQYQKTNEDYAAEISTENVRGKFLKVTRLYDFIWYGDFKVSEGDYKLAEKGFTEMDAILNHAAHE